MSPKRKAAPGNPSPTPLDPLAIPLAGTALVEASAGTGKTYTLTTLYARLLLEAGLGVEQILVVTYTNAATAELRARIRDRLRAVLRAYDGEALDGDDLARFVETRRAGGHTDADRGRLIAALHGFDQSAIFTIHGFCQRMLQEHAFESGVPFDVDFITDQKPLVEQIVRDFWVRELHGAPFEFLGYLSSDKHRQPRALARLADLIDIHPDLEIIAAAPAPDDADQTRWQRMQLDCTTYVRDELRRRKQEARQQSFNDLLQRLAQALRGTDGAALAARIRKRLRAALIDEFQDTDPVQYEIFRRIYHEAPDTALFLIGDPKQAIYAFRGADIFAYLAAKRDAGPGHTLLTNWRSGPSLVRAVNTLFQARDPFVFSDIPFLPARAADTSTDCLGGSAAGSAPFEFLFVPRRGQQGARGALTKTWGEKEMTELVAGDIVRFVASGATIGGRPVAFADVAVLCRTNPQAASMQAALRALGVPTVLQSEASVFEAPEAAEVGRVLRAMAEPSDSAAVRAALSTSLLGQSAANLHELQSDERRWDEWLKRFQDWQQIWLKHGFVAAFRRLLEAMEVIPRLLELSGGERRLTNVLHLMELLHGASVDERFGPSALAHWLTLMCEDAEARSDSVGDAAQVRLESDDAAVKLVTIHKSKGLQYPVVYCPFLWSGKRLYDDDKAAPRFHDASDRDRLKLDLGSDQIAVHRQLAEREGLAENLRLLYVALTRAQHRCTVVWGAFNTAHEAALGYLLHREEDADDPAAACVERIKRLVKDGDAAMRADLERIAARSDGAIAIRDLSFEPVDAVSLATTPESDLNCRIARRRIGLAWRTASFTSLVAASAAPSRPLEEGIDHDPGTALVSPASSVPDPVALHDFPAGTRTGEMLHGVLERLDFGTATPDSIAEIVNAALGPTDLAARSADTLIRAIGGVLDTPITDDGLCLRQVSKDKQLKELEFVFPVALGDKPASKGIPLNARRLASVFAADASPLLQAYAERVAELDFATLAGFLRGFIDLVFEDRGRWYVVDYKSNQLGPTVGAYAAERLRSVMATHHYLLQYHLYVVALHRYLKRRVRDYDYDEHFGGVRYLFLRGMAPGHPAGNGIFAERPTREMIERLSEVLAG